MNTPQPDWAQQAALLQLSAQLWRAAADSACQSDQGLGHLNDDYVQRIARCYTDMAQIAEATADSCREIAFAQAAEPQDVGRLDEVRNDARLQVVR